MDKQIYELKLAEVAEMKIPKIAVNKSKTRGRGRPTKEEQYQEEHEQVFLDMFNEVNPTMIKELVKIKKQAVDCPDCGQHCPEGRRQEIKFYNLPLHAPHRRPRCLECNLYRDPTTGKYDLKQGPATQVFLNWAKSEFSARRKASLKQSDK
jgi:hypothetical protein